MPLLLFSILLRLAATMQDLMPLAVAQDRPKTTYYHNGIGGRGNYHKRAEYANPAFRQERARFPRSLAAFFSRGDSRNIPKRYTLTVDGESSIGKARESIFPWRWFIRIGALGSRRSRRQHSPNSDLSDHGDGIKVQQPCTSSQCCVRHEKEDFRRKLDPKKLPRIEIWTNPSSHLLCPAQFIS